VQPHQLLGVATVGLDPVAGADGYQRGRDDIAGDLESREQPEQVKSAGPGLITDRQPGRTAEPVDESADRALGRLDPFDRHRAARRRQRRGHDRELVHVQRNPHTDIGGRVRGDIRHRRYLLGAIAGPGGPSRPATQPTTQDAKRGLNTRRVHAD
jgi:hypothetical protein